jgi:hypothetical protein
MSMSSRVDDCRLLIQRTNYKLALYKRELDLIIICTDDQNQALYLWSTMLELLSIKLTYIGSCTLCMATKDQIN